MLGRNKNDILPTVAVAAGVVIAGRLLFETWRAVSSTSSSSSSSSSRSSEKLVPPVVPGAYPLIGNPLGGIPNLATRIREWIKAYGNVPSNPTGFLKANIFGEKFILVCNNTAAMEVCKLRPDKIQRATTEVEVIKAIGVDGVYAAHGEVWRKDRRSMAPPLNHKNLKDYFPFLQIVTRRLIQKWKDASKTGKAIAINEDVLSYTLDNIGLIAFDQDFDCIRRTDSQHAKDIKRIFELVGMRALSPIWYWRIPVIGSYLDGGGFVSKRIEKFLRETIELFQCSAATATATGNVASSPGTTDRRSRTYLHKMLQQQDVISDSRIMGNLFTMFLAGAETTGNTIITCIWKLLTLDDQGDSSIFRELVEEARQLPNLLGEELDYETARNALPKTRAFFYELNRFFGTAPCLVFTAAESVEITGLKFRKGTNFFIDFEYLGGLPGSGIPDGRNGEPPTTFCPSRWLIKDKSDPKKWDAIKPSIRTGVPISTGFGTGVRICPGQHLAEMEVIYCLASILQNFDISLKADHPPVKMVTQFTICVDKDIELCLQEVP